jgi:processive 1,2-diacylglycerol beta-glucosyltransferase
MGAGHDGAARTLAEQLRAAGQVAEVKDFLQSGPLRIGTALRMGYEFELRHVPSAYDATYRLWYRVPWLCPAVAWLVTLLTRRRVMRWVRELDPAVVVSTYPLSTLCLGRLRSTGRLSIPAVNFITDFGVHPLWVHKGVDLNLAIHGLPSDVAARRTGRRSVFTGPAVSARFDPARLPGRDEARARFGLNAGERAVLVVAGSLGVGNVATTFSAIARDGRFLPVVVCGRDERLRQHVAELAEQFPGRALILGWTDDMPALMVACDALVENAGGLTSLEAMRVGLPVVSFDPIAGHGVENTRAMDAVGVARLAGDPDSLAGALDDLTQAGPARQAQLANAASMFRSSPADTVLASTTWPRAQPSVTRRQTAFAVRTAAAGVLAAALSWTGLTTGVAMATYAGAGVAHPARLPLPVAYVGVRLSAAEVADPNVVSDLLRLDATAILDDATVRAAAPMVRSLVTDGVTIANGGQGRMHGVRDPDLPWDQASSDSRAGGQISELIDTPIRQDVPGRRLNAWDLVDSSHAHRSLVVPNHILHCAWSSSEIRLAARNIYVVDGIGVSPGQLTTYLARLETSLASAQLTAEPLASLG